MRRWQFRRMLAAAALTPLLVVSANGDGPLFPGPQFPAGFNPRSVTTGDFNGDGVTDLATANFPEDSVSVLLNQCSSGGVVALPAELFDVLRGAHQGGGVAELADSDDAYLQVRAGLTLNPTEPPVWIEFEATSPTDIPANLSFTVESRANTGNIIQTVELFNFNTASYEIVDTGNVTTSDSSIEIQPAGNITRFVEPETGLMRARIGWRSQGLIALFPWTISIDQTLWTVTE